MNDPSSEDIFPRALELIRQWRALPQVACALNFKGVNLAEPLEFEMAIATAEAMTDPNRP